MTPSLFFSQLQQVFVFFLFHFIWLCPLRASLPHSVTFVESNKCFYFDILGSLSGRTEYNDGHIKISGESCK